MIRLWTAISLVLGFVALSFAQDRAPKGAADLVETLVHSYGPFDLKASTLQQVPAVMAITFPEDMWLVGYHTKIVDGSGRQLPRELQCHTFIGTSMPQHHSHENVTGIFSDGYTPGVDLPPGFGIFFRAGEKVIWNPMFNNRNTEKAAAAMRIELNVIRGKNLPRGLKPLVTTFRTIRGSTDLYMVSPGRDVRETTFELPGVSKIHVIGTHMHPYGASIELINLTRNQSVWKAVGMLGKDGRLETMPVYINSEGYAVAPEDRFKLVATYENPTSQAVDAMAGVFILYSPAAQSLSAHN
jgi:hypothetical protein